MWRGMKVPWLTAQSPQSCEAGLRVTFSRQLFLFTFTCCLDDLNQFQGVKYHLCWWLANLYLQPRSLPWPSCLDKQLPTEHPAYLTGLSDFIYPGPESSSLTPQMCSSHCLLISKNCYSILAVAQAKNQVKAFLTLLLSHFTYNPDSCKCFLTLITFLCSHCLPSMFKSPSFRS